MKKNRCKLYVIMVKNNREYVDKLFDTFFALSMNDDYNNNNNSDVQF